DGILISRYLLGLRGDSLTAGLADLKDDAAGIAGRIAAAGEDFDVDGKNGVNAADGIMIARYMLGVISGEGLTAGQSDASPDTTATNIKNLLP
ncbi:MAG: hypothetical protein OD817_07630, partial [Gammaproteobacteria bacterium]